MAKKKKKGFKMKKALWESFADTCFATLINIPLNYLIVDWILKNEFDAWNATMLMTSTFFTVAIARKTYVRYLFWRSEK